MTSRALMQLVVWLKHCFGDLASDFCGAIVELWIL